MTVMVVVDTINQSNATVQCRHRAAQETIRRRSLSTAAIFNTHTKKVHLPVGLLDRTFPMIRLWSLQRDFDLNSRSYYGRELADSYNLLE